MGSIERHEADVLEQRIHRPDEDHTVLEGCKKFPRQLLLLLGAILKCLGKSHHMHEARVAVLLHPRTEPIRLRQLPHAKRNTRHRGAVIFFYHQLILLDGQRGGGKAPIDQGQLQRHRQVGMGRGLCKKRNITHIVPDRVDQPHMPPSRPYNRECRQFRRFILRVDLAFLKNKREESLRAKSGGRDDIFIFVNGFPERLAPSLSLVAPKRRNPRHGENKVHACSLDSPVLE